uniref:Uncharacterized protein n=1 Tax=Sphaerodactylus townsendi TaxID=933632 RepID=A0ACB8ESF1_9SAUR
MPLGAGKLTVRDRSGQGLPSQLKSPHSSKQNLSVTLAGLVSCRFSHQEPNPQGEAACLQQGSTCPRVLSFLKLRTLPKYLKCQGRGESQVGKISSIVHMIL